VRRPAARTKPRVADKHSFPTLVRGWIANEALSNGKPGGAARLENFLPTATDVRMRSGSKMYTVLPVESGPVRSLFTYLNGANRKLFAANDGAIYDITVILGGTTLTDGIGFDLVTDEGDVIGEPDTEGVEMVNTLTGGDWSVVQFQTAGGIFLRLVNGADDPLVYDGTAFDTTPILEADGLDPKALNFVFAYKKRLFFLEKETMNAWYLPVEQIGGELEKLPLGANFSRGGSLVFGATWSLDTGGGLSEQCVFITSEGEVIAFQGDNPGDAATFSKVGTYRTGKPLGPKAITRGGGDLIMATDIGYVPLSQAVQRDFAVISPSAVSYPIETEWNERAKERSAAPWHAEVWPAKQMVVIALPSLGGMQPEMLVANARTGAWALYTGWSGTCLGLFGDRLFFGSDAGRVIEAEVGGFDVGIDGRPDAPYTATAVPLFDGMRDPGTIKEVGVARAVIRAPGEVDVQLAAHADFVIDDMTPPNASPARGGSLWGAGLWGSSTWGTEAVKLTQQDWESVAAIGFALSVSVQITSGSVAPPKVELVRIDMTYQSGDL
jgi:hypothetical protein